MFLNRIFTESEQYICDSKLNPVIHYSGKYAAKEATKKAILSSKSLKNISFKSIEIINDYDGVPEIIIHNNKLNVSIIKVSISHDKEYATATAILQL